MTQEEYYIIFEFEGDAYEKNKSPIKRIIKTKHNLSKFNYKSSIWYNPNNPTHKVKRIVDPVTEKTKSIKLTKNMDLIKELRDKFIKLKIEDKVKEILVESDTGKNYKENIATIVDDDDPNKLTTIKETKESIEKRTKSIRDLHIKSFESHLDKRVTSGSLTEEEKDVFLRKWKNVVFSAFEERI